MVSWEQRKHTDPAELLAELAALTETDAGENPHASASPREIAKLCVEATDTVGLPPIPGIKHVIEDFTRVSRAYLDLAEKYDKIKPALALAEDTIALLKRFTVEAQAVRERHNL